MSTESEIKTETKTESKTESKTENGESLKIFTLRNIPESTRKRWKVICTIESITMEEFALMAIQEKIIRYSQEHTKA